MKIIINGDDFGYSERVNQAIISLAKDGKITSTTIMANGPFFKDAINQLKGLKSCSVGVHLNISKFKPLSCQKEFMNYKMLDHEGNLKDGIHGNKLTLKMIKAIETEWKKQIDKVMEHGIQISHLDSHKHVHTIPSLFWSLKKMQKIFGIRKLRITTNIYLSNFEIPNKKLLQKKLWKFLIRNYYKTKTTDYFTSAEWFIMEINRFKNMSHKSIELMCHPGAKENDDETLLRGNWIKKAPFDFKLISYDEI